jgi:hypothetical protein
MKTATASLANEFAGCGFDEELFLCETGSNGETIMELLAQVLCD